MKLAEVLKEAIPTGTFWTHSRTVVDGCSYASPGCAHCWLEGMYRRNLPGMKPPGGASVVGPSGKFNGTVIERPDRLEDIVPKSNRRAPRVWTYWSDLFHPGVSREFRLSFFAELARCPGDFHIIITKRPEVAVGFLVGRNGKLFPNVFILVTIEDQERANKRGPLAMCLASMGWRTGALCEPLLGPIDFFLGDEELWHHPLRGEVGGCCEDDCGRMCQGETNRSAGRLSWIITGGETGAMSRPAHPDWFRSLRDQATAARVPFLFKSFGDWVPTDTEATRFTHPYPRAVPLGHDGIAGTTFGVPPNRVLLPVKRSAGKESTRTLDGRTWDEVPDVDFGGGAP